MAYRPSSATGTYSNPGNAIDTDLLTKAFAPFSPYNTWKAILFSGFPSSPTAIPVIRLSVNILLYSVSTSKWALRYSLDSGSTWTQVGDAERHDDVANSYIDIMLPAETDMSLIQVELSSYNTSFSPPYVWVYDVSLVATIPSSPTLTYCVPSTKDAPKIHLRGRLN